VQSAESVLPNHAAPIDAALVTMGVPTFFDAMLLERYVVTGIVEGAVKE